MPVPFPHRLGRVPHELVDNSLVNTAGSQVAGEAVSVGVEADLEEVSPALQAPRRTAKGLPEPAVGLIRRELLHPAAFVDDELTARILPKLPHDATQVS